jgi:hypothetical protein
VDAKVIYSEHSGVIEDVAWHQHHADIFGSVGDDKQLVLWDTRKPPKDGERGRWGGPGRGDGVSGRQARKLGGLAVRVLRAAARIVAPASIPGGRARRVRQVPQPIMQGGFRLRSHARSL